ncbi:MAG TPA: hypothetical protein ENJ29_12925 [Bacteroidetes bacterium]|nr:hypothetical protein [Bacteroidota bacterium]
MDHCHFCHSADIRVLSHTAHIDHWKCRHCGEIIVLVREDIIREEFADAFWKLSVYCRRNTLAGNTPVEIHYKNIEEIIHSIAEPRTFAEAVSRSEKWLAGQLHQRTEWSRIDPHAYLDIEINPNHWPRVVAALIEKGDFEAAVESRGTAGDILSAQEAEKLVREKRIVLMRRAAARRLPHAIPVNPQARHILIVGGRYQQARRIRYLLEIAVEAAGYEPVFADETLQSAAQAQAFRKLMLDSRLVIADFTSEPEFIAGKQQWNEQETIQVAGGVDGHVYYCAGFAAACDRPLIPVCKKDDYSLGKLGARIRTDAVVYWTLRDQSSAYIRPARERENDPEPQNLAEKVYDRIQELLGAEEGGAAVPDALRVLEPKTPKTAPERPAWQKAHRRPEPQAEQVTVVDESSVRNTARERIEEWRRLHNERERSAKAAAQTAPPAGANRRPKRKAGRETTGHRPPTPRIFRVDGADNTNFLRVRA